MVTACESCQTRHKLDTSNVKGSTVKYRCKKCDHVNLVVVNPDENKTDSRENSNTKSIPAESMNERGQASLNTAEPLQADKAIRPKISGLSIKTKITSVIVALIVISLSTVGFIAGTGGSEALSRQAENNLSLISGQKAEEYNSIFRRIQNEIEGVAAYAQQAFARTNPSEDLGFRVLMPWNGSTYGTPQLNEQLADDVLVLQRIGLVLQGLVEKNPFLELGYMATANNVMVLDKEEVAGVIEAELGYVPAQRPWYVDASSAGKTIWTQPYVDVNTKKLVVTCATPVLNRSGTVIGVVGFDVLLDTIQKDILSLDIGYDSQAFLLGKTGNFLAKPKMSAIYVAWDKAVETDSALQTANPEFKAIVKQMMAGNRGIGRHTEAGNTIITAFAPLQAIDASVGIAVSEKEVMRPALDIQRLIMVVWVGVVVVAILIGLLIGNSITKPINKLTLQADLISQGKMDLEEIPNTRKDEIGVLIESFNRLVTSLKIAMSRKGR